MDFCANAPCETGQCLNTSEGYICQCPPGVIGRRCHLRPCDYLPCHKNAICVDLTVFPASRNSFVCRCPKGLKGYNCTKVDSPCDRQPCRNNGRCIADALRNASSIGSESGDMDDIYDRYRCECPPYFYGEHCDVLTTPDFVLEFPKSGTNDYVQVVGPSVSLKEVAYISYT